MAKRTIPHTKINIVDEQKETDKAIEDLELIAEQSREQLHVNANKMGSVAERLSYWIRGTQLTGANLEAAAGAFQATSRK